MHARPCPQADHGWGIGPDTSRRPCLSARPDPFPRSIALPRNHSSACDARHHDPSSSLALQGDEFDTTRRNHLILSVRTTRLGQNRRSWTPSTQLPNLVFVALPTTSAISRRSAATVLGIAVVLVLAGDIYALRRTNRTPVTVDEAVAQLRSESQQSRDEASTGPISTPPSERPAPTSTTVTALPLSPTTTRIAPTRPAPAEDSSPTTSQPHEPPILRPPAGVYVYRTDGAEELSIGGSRRYPAVTTRTVRHGAGCAWTMELVLLAEHRETHALCSTAETLDLISSSTDVRWFGVSHLAKFTCSPPIGHGLRPAGAGTTLGFSCRAHDGSTFNGTTTYSGGESFEVEGQVRPAWRVSVDGTFVGPTRGTVKATELIDQASGHVLFEQRTNNLQQTALILDVTYHQEVTLSLVSLSPR